METNFEQIFDQEFDFSEPSIGHFDRFQKKLHSNQKRKTNKWKWISIAASVTLLFSFWINNFENSNQLDLADLSPQMEETQDYFTTVIRTEIEKINNQKTNDNANIIEDSFLQLNQLEQHYLILKTELKESDGDKRVIFAMISNYQQRIEVLQNLLEQLEKLENIKSREHENIS